MNYGTYNTRAKDLYVERPLYIVLSTSLRKRATIGKPNDVYGKWVSFLKLKTLFDEYMMYTSVLVERPVEFDTYQRIHDFCNEYSKFRLVYKNKRSYVNWLEVYDEFKYYLKTGNLLDTKKKLTFWEKIMNVFSRRI